MTAENYVEHVHDFIVKYPNGTEEEERNVWFAVRPPTDDYRWTDKDGNLTPWVSDPLSGEAFRLNGGMTTYIYNKNDIEGLRGLLDKIEKVFNEEEGES